VNKKNKLLRNFEIYAKGGELDLPSTEKKGNKRDWARKKTDVKKN